MGADDPGPDAEGDGAGNRLGTMGRKVLLYTAAYLPDRHKRELPIIHEFFWRRFQAMYCVAEGCPPVGTAPARGGCVCGRHFQRAPDVQ